MSKIRRMASPKSHENRHERQKKRIKDLDEKWKMLFNERQRPPLYSVDKYIEYLRQFTASPSLDDSAISKGSMRSNSSAASSEQQISYLLKKLKLDLKMSYESFLNKFICEPNSGLNLLLTLLKNIQKTAREDQKGTVKEKMQSKKRQMSEELECILCINFCLRYKDSVRILLKVPYGLENIAEALLSSNMRSRCTALEIMSKVLMEDEGFHRNLECFTYFRLKNCEPVRFKFLINMLMTAGSSSMQMSFQLCCMKFINSLMTSSPDGNTRIFLQSEVEMAGLDAKGLLKSVDMKGAAEREDLKKEIMDFRNGLLDVDQLLESHETLYSLNIELQQKVSELQQQLQFLRGINTGIPPTQQHISIDPTDDIRDNNNESLAGLEELDELLDSIDSDSDVSLSVSNVINPNIKRRGSNRNWRKAGRQLPELNGMDNNAIQCEKERHKDKSLPKDCNDNLQTSFEQAMRKKVKIRFIENTRAQTFLEMKTRIGLPAETIVECLKNCDTKTISTETINTLLTLLPTETEMRSIVTLDCELDTLGEAEQFLVQIMSVDHLEEKLKIILFVEQFYTLVGGMKEDVAHIKKSCKALMTCQKFHRLLEIIRNYMVDNFYTTPLDFKLSTLITLEDTLLHTTSQNLLQYLIDLVYRNEPDILFWYNELPLELDTRVSLKRLSQFIAETKNGLHAMETDKVHSSTEQFDQKYLSVCENFNIFYESFLEMEGIYITTCSTFRENPKTIEPSQLVGYVTQFTESYKEIVKSLPPLETVVGVKSEPEPDYVSEPNNTSHHNIVQTSMEKKGISAELTATDIDSFGLNLTSEIHDKERIKNWIVMTTKLPEVNTGVIRDRDSKKMCNLKYHDSDSGDSAFEGSGGRCLKKYVDLRNISPGPRASTPLSIYPADEPTPDYSRSNSPDLQEKPFDDLSSEVSRILRDFEGDLNGYDTSLTGPVKRRFYTVGSIIHL